MSEVLTDDLVLRGGDPRVGKVKRRVGPWALVLWDRDDAPGARPWLTWERPSALRVPEVARYFVDVWFERMPRREARA